MKKLGFEAKVGRKSQKLIKVEVLMNISNKKLTIIASVAVLVGALGVLLKRGVLPTAEQVSENIEQSQVCAPIAPIKPKVAIIKFYGEPNFDKVQDNLVKALKDPEIKGVLMQVDSPGGSVAHFACISDLVARVKQVKPVVTYVIGTAASGGYMVSCASDYIISSSMADIGSIGAYAEIHKHKNLKASGSMGADVDVELFTAGEFKNLTNPYSGRLNEKEKAAMQDYIDRTYVEFREFVVQNRKNIKAESYKDWAEGRIFTASKALELGLVDDIGTILDAESKALELIKARNPDINLGNEIIPVFC